jgi:hypothetical protein
MVSRSCLRYDLRAGALGMAHYRLCILDKHRNVMCVAKFDCVDEQAAKERAQQFVNSNDVELWRLDRRIALFEAGGGRTPALPLTK